MVNGDELLNQRAKRRLQLVLAVLIYLGAVVLSYYSVVQVETVSKGGMVSRDIFLLIDTSGSMGESNKLESAKIAAKEFISTLNMSNSSLFRVGILSFNTSVGEASELTSDSGSLSDSIDRLTAGGQTAIGDAVKHAGDTLSTRGRAGVNKTIVLMSDGLSNSDKISSPVEAAKGVASQGITVFAVAYGNDADTDTLKKVAETTGGKYYSALSGQDLITTYSTIARSFTLSSAEHYGSRTLIVLAIPLMLFLPQIERAATTLFTVVRETMIKKPAEKASLRFCTKCGSQIGLTAIFCNECGASTSLRRETSAQPWKTCPTCGLKNRPTATFCVSDGTRLPERDVYGDSSRDKTGYY